MKKLRLIGLLIFLISLIWAGPVYAVQVPKQMGLVTDPISLFTSQDIKRIEAALQEQPYIVHTLTAEGLDDAAGNQLANDAYDQWGLAENELILLITIEPNRVYMLFDNAELDGLIARSDTSSVTAVIDATFVPFAVEGDLVQGVIALGEYINELSATIKAPAPSKQPQDSTASPSSPSTGGLPQQEQEQGTVQVGKVLMSIVIALGSCFISLYGLNILLNRFRLSRILRNLQKQLDEVKPGLNKLVLSPLFKELELEFIRGRTKVEVAAIEQTVLQLLKSVQLYEQKVSQKVPVFRLAALKDDVKEWTVAITDIQTAVAKEAAQLHRFEELSKEVRNSVEAAKRREPEISAGINALLQEATFSLRGLKSKLEKALLSLEKADQLDEYDFLEAESLAQDVHAQFDQLVIETEQWKEQIRLYNDLPERISAREEFLKKKIEVEQLRLTDVDPFPILNETKSEVIRLAAHLNAGDLFAAREWVQTIEHKLETAAHIVDTMLKHRDEAGKIYLQLDQVRQSWPEFKAQYDQEMVRLAPHFAEEHIDEQNLRLDDITLKQEQITQLQQEMAQALEAQKQYYQQAYEMGQQALELQTQIMQLREHCLSYRSMMMQAVQQIQERYRDLQPKLSRAKVQLRKRQVGNDELLALQGKCEQKEQAMHKLLQAPRQSVYELDAESQAFANLVVQFEQLIEERHKQKVDAEVSFLFYNQDFQKRERQCRSLMNTSSYESAYRNHQYGIREALLAGAYIDALTRINLAKKLLHQMDQDYAQVLQSRHYAGGPYTSDRRDSTTGGGWFNTGTSNPQQRGTGWGQSNSGGSHRQSTGSGWGSGSQQSNRSSSAGRSSGGSSWGSSRPSSGSGGRSSGSSSFGSQQRSSGSSGWGGSSSSSNKSSGKSSGSSKW